MSRKKTPKTKPLVTNTNNEPEIVKSKPDKPSSFWAKVSLPWKIIGGIFLIISGILTTIQLYDRLTPPKEKTPKENFDEDYISSKLNPPKLPPSTPDYEILETQPVYINKIDKKQPRIKGIKLRTDTVKDPTVLFYIGREKIYVSIDILRKNGIRFSMPFYGSCKRSQISFGVLDDRLYVSTEFKSLQNEETIGIIEYNWWRLYKNNMFDFESNDTFLKVKDRQNNLVFFIEFLNTKTKHRNIVSVGGYFINSESVNILSVYKHHEYKTEKSKGRYFVFADTCIDKSLKDWKQRALVLIEKNQTIL